MTLSLLGCEPWPRDPENTTELVLESGKLRVGVIHNPPWVEVRDGNPQGREIRLVEAFAATLDVSPEWQAFGMHDGFRAIEQGEIDLLVGGLVQSSPYKAAAFTRPYEISRASDGRKLQHVLAVQRGENRFLVNLEQFLKQQEGLAK